MRSEEKKALWEQCVEFHGHVCGGLTIGYKASLYAMELLRLNFSQDEEVVCIAENDACGVDAVQVVLLQRWEGKSVVPYKGETGLFLF